MSHAEGQASDSQPCDSYDPPHEFIEIYTVARNGVALTIKFADDSTQDLNSDEVREARQKIGDFWSNDMRVVVHYKIVDG